ncbi:hypothetical protein SEMRO_3230_G345660.1 [Seminavis robusta]|uniref:Uncharacterized protein n=1 Tax=Seminavis robusta TaxID=568900 RepID=A0A9N8F437_9STRA|nr:hypothetical protein SEMRO_3230_G345660.1 [Seminavis robusta]|eukprot:Sro3230_g345660.1 n/a (148) ;mRNA; r:3912-4355
MKSNSRGLVAKSLARGSQHSMYIDGRATVTGKRRQAPKLVGSDKEFLLSLNYPQLRETARYLGLLRDCEVDGKVERSRIEAVVIHDFFEDPVGYRVKKNVAGPPVLDADLLDDLSDASFNVMDAFDGDGWRNDDDAFLDKFNLDEFN